MSRTLAGRYRLTEQIGRGGMGTVWRARDEMLGRDVAVKELSLPRGLPEEHRASLCKRAIREARVSSGLKHRSIIRVHDVIAEDDRPWIVMELLTGRALDEAGPLPPERVAEIGLAMLDALAVAHARRVLHRDVKPGNIFLCDDGRVVLTDFGIATLEGESSLTASSGLVGSPGYIAPERLRGEAGGPPSDLWSLGAALYLAVEGRPPFLRQTPMGLLSAVLTEEPEPPRRAGALGPVLSAMLVKHPARRPSADATRSWLWQVAGGDRPIMYGVPNTVGTPNAAVPTEPVRRPRRPRTVALAVVAIAVAAAAIPAAFLVGAGKGGHPAGTPSASGPVSADPVRGRFASAPAPCALLTADEAARLGTDRTVYGKAQQCTWGQILGGNSIELDIQHFAPTGQTSAPSLAQAYYTEKRRHVSLDAHSNDALHSTQSGVTDVPATGDAAFAYNATSGFDAERSATVWLRSSNVVAEVVYTDSKGTTAGTTLRQNAIAAARTIGARLAHGPS